MRRSGSRGLQALLPERQNDLNPPKTDQTQNSGPPLKPQPAEGRLGEALVEGRLITQRQLEQSLATQKSGAYQPLGQILIDQGSLTPRQLKHFLQKRPGLRLGDLLVRSGTITSEQLQHALLQQKQLNLPLGQTLIKLNYLTDMQMRKALSLQLNIQYVDLDRIDLDPNLARIINGAYARRLDLLPIGLIANLLTVVMDDPTREGVIEELTRSTGRTIRVVTSSQTAIQRAMHRLYGDQESEAPSEATAGDMEILAEEITARPPGQQPDSDRGGDQLFRQLLRKAIDLYASDIHLEMMPGKLYTRFRMDGILHEPDLGALQNACNLGARAIVSRIKILGGLDIAERRRPQDGSFRVQVEHDGETRPIDLRISIVPSYYGESVVLRVLDRSRVPQSVGDLGLSAKVTERLRQLLARPTGCLLVTGPTGSGKSTTMYASLLTVYKPQIKILTAEDPIEYVFEQFSQSQVNEQIGNTFVSYLRAFLRHDPEVIMVGEIRDRDTAEMAFRAAQTGHMLISTLHTNTAIGVVPRVLELGVDASLVASALNGVMNQRLVRQVCQRCKVEYTPSAEIFKEFFAGAPPPMRWWRGQGCEHCGYSGYARRMIISELWVPSEEDAILIAKGARFDDIRASAERSTVSMMEDAKEKLVAGRTNLEEVLRTLPYETIYKLRLSWEAEQSLPPSNREPAESGSASA